MTSHVRPRDVVGAIFENCEGYVELRALPSRTRLFVQSPAEIEAIAQFCRERMAVSDNVYFGVATRRDATGGDLGHCLHLGALFADIDRAFDADRILSAPFAPSIVIESGSPGAYHLYYLLREPLDLVTEAARTRDLLRRLATWANGDRAAGEPARILRMPGTSNYKHSPARPVRICEHHPHRRFNACDLEEWLPTEPVVSTATSIDLSSVIGQNRNVSLYRLGRALKGKRLPDALVATTLRVVNDAHCKPSLCSDELEQIVHNVLTQADRPFPPTTRGRVEVAADVE